MTPIIKGFIASTLDWLLICDDTTTNETVVTNKDELQHRLIDRNIKHFGQEKITPFASELLCSILPLLESNPFEAKKLLAGDTSSFHSLTHQS